MGSRTQGDFDACLKTADQFFDMAVRIASENIIDNVLKYRFPFAVNIAIACELYLKAIAEINGQSDKLKKIAMTAEDQAAEETAEEVEAEHKERLSPFTFSKCNIKPGEYIAWYDDPEQRFKVLDDKTVEYKGKAFTLSGLAALLLGKDSSAGVGGPRYFKYEGRWLNDIRSELES